MVSNKIGAAVKVEYNGELYTARINGVQGESLIYIMYDEIDRSEWLYRGSLRLEEIFMLHRSNESILKRKISEETNDNVENLNDKTLLSNDDDIPIDCVIPQTGASSIALPESIVQKRTMDQCRQVKPREVEQDINNNVENKGDKTLPSNNDDMPIECVVPQTGAFTIELPESIVPMRVTTRCRYVKPNRQVGYVPVKLHTRQKCGPRCCTTNGFSERAKASLLKFGPLMQPMIMGWKRVSRTTISYVAPCGKSIPNMNELKKHLAVIECKAFDVDNFCFDSQVNCLREYYTNHQFILSQVLQSLSIYPANV